MISRLRHIGANLVILTVLSVLFVDALPATCTAHEWAKIAIDPVLDKTGLWQQTWQLFAPEPASINTRFTALLEFEDGSEFTWYSPDWENLSVWRKFRDFRQIEFYDSLRNNPNSWDSFASYLALSAEAERGGAKATKVELIRHSVVIPPPDETQRLVPVGGEWTKVVSETMYVWTAKGAVE